MFYIKFYFNFCCPLSVIHLHQARSIHLFLSHTWR